MLVIVIIFVNPPKKDVPPSLSPVVNQTISVPVESNLPTGEVICHMRIDRGKDSFENLFFIGNQQIASQKVLSSGKIEDEGEIPDGKVKLVNDFDGTHGEAIYKKNRKQGLAKMYFPSGHLKSEEHFYRGQLLRAKEFYDSGQLRFEIDYQDARYIKNDKEIGVGKLYFPNGQLKYEWNITRHNPVGYKRSYNQDGTLRAETKIDQQGQLIP